MDQLGSEYEFTIQWHSFELEPSHSGKPKPLFPTLANKYGKSEEEMRANQRQMMMVAKDLGLNFDKLQERLICNTFDAHRLVKWAGEQSQQTAMKQALFDVYFGQGLDVSDHSVLLGCVEALGMDPVKALEILTSDLYTATVREDQATYQQMGVTSVPAYIINNKYLIPGAQEPDTLVQAFRNISAES